jgi:thiamine-phosphate pyrophosphorylase
MRLHGKFPSLYPILDASYLAAAKDRAAFLRDLVEDLAAAGIGILQYRNKTGDEAEILADARAMRAAVRERMVLILNDWPELALSAGLDGVHLGQTDLSPDEARGIMGPSKMIGVSTHNEAQLRAADLQPVDYIAIGPVFATTTKQNPDPVVGLEGVRIARSLTQKTLVAIGGITRENAAMVRQAGADSVAVISAIFAPDRNPAKLAEDLLRALQ